MHDHLSSLSNDEIQKRTGDETEKQTASRNNSASAPVTARGEATRQRILDAAEEVFGESGYYEASVSEITRRAGVAQGTFYIYFPSKREIFVELIEELGRHLRAATRNAMAGASDRLEAERRGFAAFFDFAAKHRRIYNIVQEAERVVPEAARAYYLAISRGYARDLRAAMEAGMIREMPSPEAIAYALMGIGHFVALRWLIWSQDQQDQQGQEGQEAVPTLPPEVFETVVDFIT
ncbi:MAG: TetR/AcrR family transcriptional regulator, partial [Ktedonobacteraceae bacterium]|nr:TetR/AcrR family transcriptional regulator [Ktedonobacteraceae bacterium]